MSFCLRRFMTQRRPTPLKPPPVSPMKNSPPRQIPPNNPTDISRRIIPQLPSGWNVRENVREEFFTVMSNLKLVIVAFRLPYQMYLEVTYISVGWRQILLRRRIVFIRQFCLHKLIVSIANTDSTTLWEWCLAVHRTLCRPPDDKRSRRWHNCLYCWVCSKLS